MVEKYGYARVSTKDQNPERQIIALKEAGLDEKHIFVDKISGKSFDRPYYNLLVGTERTAPLLRAGDTLIMTSIDRMGRNYSEILAEWRRLTEMQIKIKILDMPILDTSEYNGTSVDRRFICDLVLQILSYVAEKERLQIKKRQKEGIEAAKKSGKQIGRPSMPYPLNWDAIYAGWQNGELMPQEAIQKSGLIPRTFYKLAARYEEEKGIKRKRYYNYRALKRKDNREKNLP